VSAPAAGWRLGVGTVRWPGPGCWQSLVKSVSNSHDSDRDLFAWVDLGRPRSASHSISATGPLRPAGLATGTTWQVSHHEDGCELGPKMPAVVGHRVGEATAAGQVGGA